MDGLMLRLPDTDGWRTLEDPATTSVFLSTQQLALPEGGCAHALDGFCTPLARGLGKGGVLVMFRQQPGKTAVDKMRGYEVPVEDQDTYKSCRTVGGTRQLGRTMVGPQGTNTLVWAVACLARPTEAQLAQVRSLLASAAIG
ncbi:MAG: hypothetical protein HOY69_37950 [Streptomyces sp.]|nr:hypothetical protein [Streptomyces sp.]